MKPEDFIIGHVDDMDGFFDEHYKGRPNDIVIKGESGITLEQILSDHEDALTWRKVDKELWSNPLNTLYRENKQLKEIVEALKNPLIQELFKDVLRSMEESYKTFDKPTYLKTQYKIKMNLLKELLAGTKKYTPKEYLKHIDEVTKEGNE